MKVARIVLAETVALGTGINDKIIDIDNPKIESMEISDYGVKITVKDKRRPRIVPSSNVLSLVLDVAEHKEHGPLPLHAQEQKRGRGRPPKVRYGKDG